jgi:hypothetical protein
VQPLLPLRVEHSVRIATDENGRSTYTIHQSWLNTFFDCPELARRIAFEGLWDPGSDATAIGTALHAGAEHYLRNGGASFDDCYEAAVVAFRAEVALEGFRWVQVKSEATALNYLRVCLQTWFNDVLPRLGAPVAIEHHFKQPLYSTDTYDVMVGGAIDYVDDNGIMWDWKTAMDADKYGKRKQWEHKRWSIQPTVYNYAWWKETGENAPFIFAACLKGTQPKPAQFVQVDRDESHHAWLRAQIVPIVEQTLADLSQWALRDTHVLCSPKWCPAWDTCKGMHVTM